MENLQKHMSFTSSSTNTTNNINNNNSNNNASKNPAPTIATMGLNPGGSQRSVFHVKVDHNFYSEEESKHRDNLRNYKEMHKKYDEAGSRLAEAFANSLKDTVHDGFAKKCNTVLSSVFGGNSLVMAQISELGNLLSGLLNKMDTKEQEEKQISYNQVMLKCLLLFLKIQQDYHKQCTEVISSFIQSINQQSSTDLLSLLVSLDLTSSQLSPANTDFTSLQSGGTNNNNNNNNNTNVNNNCNESKTELKSEAATSGTPTSQSTTVTDCSLRSAATSLNGQMQNKLSSMPSTSPSPSSSSSSPSSSVFSSSLEPSFSLFTKLNALYIPIGQTAGQSIDTDTVPSTTAVVSSSSSSSTASTVLTIINSDSQIPSHWPKTGVQPLVGAIGKNEKGASAYVKSSAAKANGQLASEEELNSVINLLSGGMVLSQPPPAPPPPPLHMPNQLQPSPLLHAPPTGGSVFGSLLTSSDADDQHKMYRANAHRHSEGSLDLSGMTTLSSGGGAGSGAGSSGRGGGRNTWPHPNHHHRSSLPAGPLGSHSLLNYDSQQQPPQEDYPRMLDSTGSLDQRGSLGDVYLSATCHPHDLQSGLYALSTCAGGGNFMSNSHWTFPDTKLNRTWPVSSLSTGGGGGGSDTMNSSWSGVQDSSDLSDDSSSGEQFFAVGLDLVHAMDSKDSSSEDDADHQRQEGRIRAPMVSQSLENLYDRKSTYTWPPKHPWARRSDLLLNSPELECTVSTPAATGSATATPSLPSSGPWTADPLQPPRNMWAPGMPNQSQSSQSLSHQSYGTLQ